MRTLSIRAQVLGIVLAVAIPLTGVIAAQGLLDARVAIETSSAASRALSEQVAGQIGQNLALADARLRTIAERPLVAAVDATRCDPGLPDLLTVMPEFANLAVIDPHGDVICSVVPQPGGVAASVADTTWFATALETRELVVGEPFIGPITNRWVSVQALPIIGADGVVRGVVALPIDLIDYVTLVSGRALPEEAVITVIDTAGTVVARSIDAEASVGRNGRGTEIVDEVLEHHAGAIVAIGMDGVERAFGFTEIPGADWYAYVGVPTSELLAPIAARLALTLGVALPIVALFTLLALRLGDRVVRPVRALAEAARTVAEGEASARAPMDGPAEIAEVAQAFNTMLDARDATERSVSFQANLLANVNDAVVAINDVQRVVYWNPAAARLYGYSEDEAIGRPSTEVIGSLLTNAHRAEIFDTIRTTGSWSGEVRHTHRDGRSIDVDIRASAAATADGSSVIIAVLRDVTESLRMSEINAELDAFSYSVSHDLRAPLRAMHGFAAALIEDEAERLSEPGLDYATRIVAAAGRMELLIDDLLAYGRLARADLRITSVALDRVLADALEQLDAAIRNTGARVHADGRLGEVRGHGPTLVQVVANLLGNALKYVPAGTTPEIVVRAEAVAGARRLWVEDNGLGIATEHHGRIFRPFERLHGVEAYAGTGIGLAVVRRGVERMGGSCGVESQPGQGSRFWIELPEGGRP